MRRAPSHWLSQVDPEAVPEVDSLPAQADVVVVGGGVMGVSTTYWLARSGINVLLLESRRLAWGASGRNGGLFLGGSSSLDKLQEVLREEGINADYDEPGHLALASSPPVLEQMRQEVAARPTTATPVHVLDRVECEDLLGMRIDRMFLGGRHMPRAATIHPTRFIYGLAASAARRGAMVAQRTVALSLKRVSGGEHIDVETPRGRVRASRVALACNVRTSRLCSQLKSLIKPSRGQMMSTHPMRPIFRLGLAVDWGAVYWRQSADGVIVLGGRHNLDPVAETSSREALNPRIQSALSSFLPEAFPDFPAFAVSRRWAGIMDQTIDGKPIIGRWPSDPNIWIVAGFGGHGLPPALSIGETLAKAIASDRHVTELDPYDPARFKKALQC